MLSRLLQAESTWQLFDQGAVSGGNFLTNLVLARTLTPDLYGTFSLLFGAFLGLNIVHAAVVIYPLTLTTATSEREGVRSLAGDAILQTALLLPAQSLVLLATALVMHQLALLPLMIPVLFAWQLQETMRRTLLACERPQGAFLPDILSYVGQASILLLLRPTSLVQVLVIMLATSTSALLVQQLLVRCQFTTAFSMEHIRRSWRLGRYTLTANLLTLVSSQIPGWTLAVTYGRSSVAYFQAIYNLVGIANPLLFSVSNLVIPSVARASKNGTVAARAAAMRSGLQFAGLLVLPALLLLFAPHLSMQMIYGKHSVYLQFSYLLRYLAPALLLDYGTMVIGGYEGGNGRPQSYMYVQMLGTVVIVVLGVPLIRMLGLQGEAIALLTLSACKLVAFFLLSRRNDGKAARASLAQLLPLEEAL